MQGANAWAEFGMAIKRLFVMYVAFAYAYLPIRVYVISVLLSFVIVFIITIRKRDPWILGLFFLGLTASYILTVVEGKATYYRAAQFLPLVCGFLVLLLFYAFSHMRRLTLWTNRLLCVVLAIVIFRQCVDMNRWFYIDDVKYQDAIRTMQLVVYELDKRGFGDRSVVFTGQYSPPKSIVEDAFVPYGSETFYQINALTQCIDPHLLEKFYRPEGVWVAQSPSLSVIGWGAGAFGTDEELIRFAAMHGLEMIPMLDEQVYPIAIEYSWTLPHFPLEGSIVDMGDYVIINL
jgi:hypothetical protein